MSIWLSCLSYDPPPPDTLHKCLTRPPFVRSDDLGEGRPTTTGDLSPCVMTYWLREVAFSIGEKSHPRGDWALSTRHWLQALPVAIGTNGNGGFFLWCHS